MSFLSLLYAYYLVCEIKCYNIIIDFVYEYCFCLDLFYIKMALRNMKYSEYNKNNK